MSLATGLGKGDFQSQNTRRLLAKLGFVIGKGNSALAAAPSKASPTRSMAHPAPSVSQLSSADAVLVG